MTEMLLIALIAAAVVLVVVVFALRGRKPKAIETAAPTEEAAVVPAKAEPKKRELSDRLGKTRHQLFDNLSRIFAGAQSTTQWEELEEILLEGDVGVRATRTLIEGVKKQANSAPLRILLGREFESMLSAVKHGAPGLNGVAKPYVISIVGINGVGKTTTIGKLAHWFKKSGKTVLLGAADTFRAAAISQLKVWAERAGVEIVVGREGGDPGAVAFDAVTAGKARGIDVVMIDTAGRLHTKSNLMEELKKIHRVIQKVIPEAPHETWLILDGTAGQNSIRQAEEFQKALALTGAIVTKLDGTAKGGAILSVATDLKLPIRFIGVGEAQEDLISFESRAFVQAILGE